MSNFINHKRKRNRLQYFDYSKSGFYFVTVCVKNKIECLGEIKNDKIILNPIGQIVEHQWLWLKEQYKYIFLDEFIVMPNHFHGILIIDANRENLQSNIITDRSRPVPTGNEKIKSLSQIIGAFKTTSSKKIHQNGMIDFLWQRSFYDHIIRNEKSLNNIRKYIIDNPLKWTIDRKKEENLYY